MGFCQAGDLLWKEDGMSDVFICDTVSADHDNETAELISKGGKGCIEQRNK